jgi:predicted enzyme related to lactoylglutathione lyase
MKRFHVHLQVEDIPTSMAFYSALFASQPVRVESDYAKWMLDDPRINFAISTRGGKPGIDHLGFQVDDVSELTELRARAESADMAVMNAGETTCCYSRSDKHWLTDPQGVAWEQFHTLGDVPVFSANPLQTETASACCAPQSQAISVAADIGKSRCC